MAPIHFSVNRMSQDCLERPSKKELYYFAAKFIQQVFGLLRARIGARPQHSAVHFALGWMQTPLLTRTEAFAAKRRQPFAPKAIFYGCYSTKLPLCAGLAF